MRVSQQVQLKPGFGASMFVEKQGFCENSRFSRAPSKISFARILNHNRWALATKFSSRPDLGLAYFGKTKTSERILIIARAIKHFILMYFES